MQVFKAGICSEQQTKLGEDSFQVSTSLHYPIHCSILYSIHCFIHYSFNTCLLVSFSGALDKQTIKLTNKSVFSLAFEASASSSGGIQTLIDTNISQDEEITTIKSESEESEVLTSTFKSTGKKR